MQPIGHDVQPADWLMANVWVGILAGGSLTRIYGMAMLYLPLSSDAQIRAIVLWRSSD